MTKNIIVVDENDNVIGNKPRDVVDKEKLIYRVTGLWIQNSKKENLLARRAYNKTHYPGRWGPAVAGTVDEGESYEENMIKEVKEELGLEGFKLKKSKKMQISGKYNHFTQWFILILDKLAKDFKIQKEEVVEVKWFSKEELLEQLKKNPDEFLPNLKKYAEMFI
jgi:isopentenyldiphosphate isomerase